MRNFLIAVLFLSVFVHPLSGMARPLCSVIFSHDFAVDKYADLRHEGALDVFKDLNRRWTFADKALPEVALNQSSMPSSLPLSEIRFMQNHISNNYGDARFTVAQNARNIREGLLNPESLPPIQVWMDQSGKVWTLDHRRLAAMILSGKVDSTRVQWASKDDVLRQSYKMSNLADGDLMILSDKKDQAILVKRPYAKVKKGRINAINKSRIPKVFKDIAPSMHRQTVVSQAQPLSEALPAHKIFFSRSEGTQVAVQAIFHKLQQGELLVTDLPPLRVWTDSSSRVWTADNDVLAAVRMFDANAVVKVQNLTAAEVQEQRLQVDSQTGGHILIVPISNTDQAYLIQ